MRIDAKDGVDGVSAFEEMVRLMPDVALLALDRCQCVARKEVWGFDGAVFNEEEMEEHEDVLGVGIEDNMNDGNGVAAWQRGLQGNDNLPPPLERVVTEMERRGFWPSLDPNPNPNPNHNLKAEESKVAQDPKPKELLQGVRRYLTGEWSESTLGAGSAKAASAPSVGVDMEAALHRRQQQLRDREASARHRAAAAP
uniref:Uncharacterized protein n=1 Tax=Phaeomonas parva TaxID=124430 RepID=A0A7S1XNN0_9STRA|mmetsp:Transcript_19691/g.59629  ORF Transcript_19691/g.59629 Transcript_19691/m.59629 type:complete len:197 (+) Transcript_19691:787-1377(+)